MLVDAAGNLSEQRTALNVRSMHVKKHDKEASSTEDNCSNDSGQQLASTSRSAEPLLSGRAEAPGATRQRLLLHPSQSSPP